MWSSRSKETRSLKQIPMPEEVQSGMTKEVRPNEESWNEFYGIKICICPLQAVAFIIWSLGQKWSTVPFTRALKYYIPLGDISIVAWPSSLKREAYGMGKELGHHLGRGTRFRHEGGVEDLLLPDGITSTGSTQEEVILALCHYNIGTLHGSQLSCIGGMSRRWGLEKHKHW